MDNFENAINDIFEIENIDKMLFKSFKINQDKIIYFAFRERQKIMFGKLTSIDLTPIGFILKMNEEYHYCPLDDKELNEEMVKEFVLKFIS